MTGETAAAGAAGLAETEEPIGPATETGKPAGPATETGKPAGPAAETGKPAGSAAETGKPAAAATGTEAAQRPAARQRKSLRRTRRYLARFSPAGLTGALAIGIFVGWLARTLVPWHPPPPVRSVARWALAVAAVVLIPLFGVLGARWQHQVRQLVGAAAWASIIPPPGWTPERTAALARQPAD